MKDLCYCHRRQLSRAVSSIFPRSVASSFRSYSLQVLHTYAELNSATLLIKIGALFFYPSAVYHVLASIYPPSILYADSSSQLQIFPVKNLNFLNFLILLASSLKGVIFFSHRFVQFLASFKGVIFISHIFVQFLASSLKGVIFSSHKFVQFLAASLKGVIFFSQRLVQFLVSSLKEVIFSGHRFVQFLASSLKDRFVQFLASSLKWVIFSRNRFVQFLFLALSLKGVIFSSHRFVQFLASSLTVSLVSNLCHPRLSRATSSSCLPSRSNKDILCLLPQDVIEFIAQKLTFEFYLRFSDTSKSMRNSAKEEIGRYHKPWVMLSNKPGDKTRPFYSPLEGKVYNVKLPKVVRRSWCCGSYQGWLILAHKTRGNFVYNPITNVRFRLPTHQVENVHGKDWPPRGYKKGTPRTLRQHMKRSPYFLSKVVLSNVSSSSSPSSSPLLAATLTENHMILITVCHPGQVDIKWRQFCPAFLEEVEDLLSPVVPPIYRGEEEDDPQKDEEEEVELIVVNGCEEYNDDEEYDRDVTDIVFYKGDLYGINTYAKLTILTVTDDYDFSIRRPDMHPLKLKRKDLDKDSNLYYLVESCHGELLLVVRIRDGCTFWKDDQYCKGYFRKKRTHKFLLFRLDDANGEPFKWVPVESIGDQVLFLGQNNSVSVSSSHIKGRRNCIYFTDSFHSHYYIDHCFAHPRFYQDVGVYHFDEGRIENLIPDELDPLLYTLQRQPILFTPNPW